MSFSTVLVLNNCTLKNQDFRNRVTTALCTVSIDVIMCLLLFTSSLLSLLQNYGSVTSAMERVASRISMMLALGNSSIL